MADIDQELHQNMSEIKRATNHTCKICEMVFNSKNKLKYHFGAVHDSKDEIHTCNICTQSFQQQ